MDDVDTECVVCGSHIIAGSYPPVCSDYCKWEYNLEVEFNRWAKNESKKTRHTTIKDS